MNDPAVQKSPSRGRPPNSIKRQVVQKVLAAAEAALKDKTAQEVKVRDIAAEAGVNATIVNYYFGGKDGLMVAILHEVMRDAPYGKYDPLLAACVKAQSIGPVVEEFARFYYSRPGLIRMTMNEMMSTSSEVKAAYRARYVDSTPEFVERVIRAMMDLGIYNRHFDPSYLALSVLRMLLAPMGNGAGKYNLSNEQARAEWISFTSGLIDQALKSPALGQSQ
jgi:AcrR family transcriptional regulator